MSMQELIAKIAKGPRAAKDLTWDEAKQAMKALIEGDATPAQVGAFLWPCGSRWSRLRNWPR